MYSGNTINLFVNSNMITNRQKAEIPMDFMTNTGSKMIYKVREVTGSGQTRFHPEMIANVLSLNEMTKKYRVTFDSGNENDFKVHIGDDIFRFPVNDDGLYLSKPDNIFRK